MLSQIPHIADIWSVQDLLAQMNLSGSVRSQLKRIRSRSHRQVRADAPSWIANDVLDSVKFDIALSRLSLR